MRQVRVLDTTLRDGSHAMSHRFQVADVRAVTAALANAGVDAIEVAHGDGIAGGCLQSGFCEIDELQLIAAAAKECQEARVAVMILPGVGTSEDLLRAVEAGARIVRVATLCTQADLARRHIALARARGIEAIGFLMMAHLAGPDVLADQAAELQRYGANCVYLADSAGSLLPDDVRIRMTAVREAVDVEIGFHAHNNLGSAMGNCIAALHAGADRLDGSLRGLGAGAGNAPTELIAVALERLTSESALDVAALVDAAEEIIEPLMPFQPIPDRDSILLGRAGVYSTFLLPARHAAERYGVDARTVVAELGRRQAVVGQDDLPFEIAIELAREGAVA